MRHPPEHHSDEQQAQRPDAVDDAAGPPGQVPAGPRRDPRGGERSTDQQAHDVGVGAEVDAGGVRRLGVAVGHRQREHGRRGQQCADQGSAPDRLGAAQPPGQQEQPRPEQVELLLHRQRPQVLQHGRATGGLEIGLVGQDVDPVRDIGQCGRQVALLMARGIRCQRDDQQRRPDEHREQGRQQAPRPADVEAAQVRRAGARGGIQEQGGDEEAGQHEEDVDAEEAPRRPRQVCVIGEDGQDGDRAQPVQRRLIAEPAAPNPGLRGSPLGGSRLRPGRRARRMLQRHRHCPPHSTDRSPRSGTEAVPSGEDAQRLRQS